MTSIYDKVRDAKCPECTGRLTLDYDSSTNEYTLICLTCGWDESQEQTSEESEPLFIPEGHK